MSTNIYLRRVVKQSDKDMMIKLINENKLFSHRDWFGHENDVDSVEDIIYDLNNNFHVGHFAGGWKFLFRTHLDKYPEDTLAAFKYIEDAVASGDYILINEYDEELDVKKWEADVLETVDGLTLEEHYRNHPNCYRSYNDERVDKHGMRWLDCDFS